MSLDLLWSGVEELAPLVDTVDAAVGEALVQLRLDADRVVGEEQLVRVLVDDGLATRLGDRISASRAAVRFQALSPL